MGALFVSGRAAEALAAGKRAVELNPFDSDIPGDLGARYVQSGEAAQGEALLRQAVLANPAPPDWQMFHLFLAAYAQTKTWTLSASANLSACPLCRCSARHGLSRRRSKATRARAPGRRRRSRLSLNFLPIPGKASASGNIRAA